MLRVLSSLIHVHIIYGEIRGAERCDEMCLRKEQIWDRDDKSSADDTTLLCFLVNLHKLVFNLYST